MADGVGEPNPFRGGDGTTSMANSGGGNSAAFVAAKLSSSQGVTHLWLPTMPPPPGL